MIAKTISWSLRNKLIVLFSAFGLLVWGTYQTTQMPIDVFPDLTAPTVTVLTEAHGMAPIEVEKRITFPLESALNSASGVRRVRSSSSIGLSVINVEFEWGMDIYRARQIVTEKIQVARNALPPGIESPILTPISSIMGEVMFVALTAKAANPMQLKTIAEWTIRPRLLAINGVAEVISHGGDTKQYQVIVHPERLAAYKLSLLSVVQALKNANLNISTGFYKERGQEYLIHGIGQIQSINDIKNTAITTRNKQPILINDIATVKIGPALKRGEGAFKTQAAVIIGIQKQPNVNTLALTQKLDKVLDDIQTGLPNDIRIEKDLFRQANFITVAIDNLSAALRDGTIMVIVIVMAFLINIRATLITLLAIPLSLVASIIVLSFMGSTINTMTLGGMAIALGALVDDAIIVVENIVRRLHQNQEDIKQGLKTRLQVILAATHEIQGSIVFATIIIMIVFLPLFFLTGIESRLMQPLAIAYLVSLAASLLVAISVTPVLSHVFLKSKKANHVPAYIGFIKKHYESLLNSILYRWRSIGVFSLILIVITLLALLLAGRSFLPNFNEGSLTISAVTLPGTSLEQSNILGDAVEKIILKHPEVVATARRTGRAERDPHEQGIHASEIDVALAMKQRSKNEFLTALRQDLSIIKGMNIIIGQPISHRIDHMLSGTRANIAVKIFGPDLYQLRQLAKQAKTLISTIPGTADVTVEQQTDIPLVSLKVNRQLIAKHGLSIKNIMQAIETALNGKVVGKIFEKNASFDLLVRYDHKSLKNFHVLKNTLFIADNGQQFTLDQFATVKKDLGPNRISRENAQRKIVVMVNVSGRDLVSVVNDIKATLNKNLKYSGDYFIVYGGQFESAQSATQTLLLFGLLVIAAIFILLNMAFKSIRDALLIMINLPLALIGGVIGMYLSDGTLSVASLIGFITLFGIATRNGVMMISHIHTLFYQENVKDPIIAIKQGASERLIPILMTALGTGLALIPLALSAGLPGSEIQAPMAIVIMFGLLTSTALNMIVLPVLYYRYGSIAKHIRH